MDLVHGQAAFSSGPWDLDMSNDGALLACGVAPDDGGEPFLHVLRTTDGTRVAAWSMPERHFGRGVAFLGSSELVYLAQPYEGITESFLFQARLDDSGPGRELRRYPPFSIHHGIVRDAAARFFAVLGKAVEVYDAAAGELRFELPGHNRDVRDVRAAFSRDGSRLYAYGTVEGAVVCYDTADGAELRRWPAPAPGGGQVLVTPDDRFLVATGTNHLGVYVYDLAQDHRLAQDADGILTFNEDQRWGPWVTTPDGGTLAVLRGSLNTYDMPDLRKYGARDWIDPESSTSAWQCAWAYDEPMFAFGVARDNRVLWFRLHAAKDA